MTIEIKLDEEQKEFCIDLACIHISTFMREEPFCFIDKNSVLSETDFLELESDANGETLKKCLARVLSASFVPFMSNDDLEETLLSGKISEKVIRTFKTNNETYRIDIDEILEPLLKMKLADIEILADGIAKRAEIEVEQELRQAGFI